MSFAASIGLVSSVTVAPVTARTRMLRPSRTSLTVKLSVATLERVKTSTWLPAASGLPITFGEAMTTARFFVAPNP
jgi:hypothetical protein